MIKLSNSYILRIVTRLLILLAIAKAISLVVWWLLPSDGVELQVKDNYKPKYNKVDFKNMLDLTSSSQVKSNLKLQVSSDGISITNMLLKGLYGKGSSGFAIVALKSSSKITSIVSVGEFFSGYTLKAIMNNGVLFTKAGKEYVLNMEHSKLTKESVVRNVDNSKTKDVSRKDIKFYAKNPKQIWKDIAITEVRNGKSIEGFKITRIKRNSKMANLGLKKGDVIIRVNNVDLKSYKDALDIYAKIDKLEAVEIVIIRKNQEMELLYEIN